MSQDYRLRVLKDEYQQLLDTCLIEARWIDTIKSDVERILTRRTYYQDIEQKTSVPWWAIGILHCRESRCSLDHHLHNGDPLKERTINRPSGRPIQPPADGIAYSWSESALDALMWKKFNEAKDQSFAAWLWRFEILWNGAGYRMRGIRSEYLWNGSNHFGKPPHCGKFVADGEFSPTAESSQVGAGVLLWWMKSRGMIHEPTQSSKSSKPVNHEPVAFLKIASNLSEIAPGASGALLKRSTAQSSGLPPDWKHQVNLGQAPIPVLAWSVERDLATGDYYKCFLGVAIYGCSTWYAHQKYWELVEVKNPATPVTESNPVSIQVQTQPQSNILYAIAQNDKTYSREAIASDQKLALQLQDRLKNFWLLGKPDGKWGDFSQQALENFKLLKGIREEGLGKATAQALINTNPHLILKGWYLSGDWLSKTILWYSLHNFFISTGGSNELNICYFRGMNRDGSLNENEPFVFNDRRCIFVVKKQTDGLLVPEWKGNWLATCDPGEYYWENPLNSLGCANIKAWQYQAWVTGYHHDQFALVQSGRVTVLRGAKRIPDTGDGFGINQHSVARGQDYSKGDAIRLWSAGCMVGASREEHDEEFMPTIKSDPREQANRGKYRHWTAVINGRDFFMLFNS